MCKIKPVFLNKYWFLLYNNKVRYIMNKNDNIEQLLEVYKTMEAYIEYLLNELSKVEEKE